MEYHLYCARVLVKPVLRSRQLWEVDCLLSVLWLSRERPAAMPLPLAQLEVEMPHHGA